MRNPLVFLLLGCSAILAQVHKLPASPGWFPDDASGLERVLDDCFRTAQQRTGSAPPRKQLLGLIVPHAGLAYSGAVAAAAYSRLDHPKTVIVLAFSHERRMDGIATPALDAYSTALGEVHIDQDAVRALGFRREPEKLLCDHSLENQIPFLQRVAPQAQVVPLYVGELSPAELTQAAAKLATLAQQGDVIVASSDLTHYGLAYGYVPFPNDERTPERLRSRATEIFGRIGSLDVSQFDGMLSETHDNLCGWAPIRLLMATMARWKEEVYMSPLDYMTSGELVHDYRTSVSYGALAFYPASSFTVTPDNQARLLQSARETLNAYLATGQKKPVPVPAAGRGPELEQRSGLFVTVTEKGKLRGCIGSFAPAMPLWDAVADRTLEAAADDPRFQPLKASEGPVSLEVSLLTPLKRLAGWRDFRPGHGALLVLGGKSGTLLPQVAREMHWDRRQFLENLALKAGLERDDYRNPHAILYVYSAQVFAERPAGTAREGGSGSPPSRNTGANRKAGVD
jgi:AmmeMemoRadiSam system protein B/AmmeMemoRadiSam system protein A